jgi:hypothetical protein
MVLLCFVAAGVLLTAVGVVLLVGRGFNLLAGYNRMSPAERSRLDEKALGRWVGSLCLVEADLIILTGVFAQRDNQWATVVTIVVSLGLAVSWVVWVSRSARFRSRSAPVSDR